MERPKRPSHLRRGYEKAPSPHGWGFSVGFEFQCSMDGSHSDYFYQVTSE